jgi:hypothetical protein
VLNAGQTFYLAQALLMAIYLRRRARSRRLWNAMAAILAVTIVLLQHRSVWVALAIAAAAVAWREGALRRLLLWTAALALIAGCAMLPMAERFSRGNTVAESIGASIAEPFDPEKSTFAWRIGVWQSYLLEYAGAPVAGKIFGTGLGNPASYAVAAMEVEFSAHNYFIYTLNRTGAAGLLALAAVYWTLLRRLRGARGSWDYLGLLFAATVSQLIYCTVYSPSYDQGLLIGAVFGIVSGRLSRDQQPVCRDSGPQPA